MDGKLLSKIMEEAAGMAYWEDSTVANAVLREFVLNPTDLQRLRAVEQNNRKSTMVQRVDTGTFMFCGYAVRPDKDQPEGMWELIPVKPAAKIPSRDAIVFGMAYLYGPKSTLSFGGDGAEMEITNRGRKALEELIEAGFCEVSEPTSSIPNREYYRGKGQIAIIAKEQGFDPFNVERWVAFQKVQP